jgi:hypothetical protein
MVERSAGERRERLGVFMMCEPSSKGRADAEGSNRLRDSCNTVRVDGCILREAHP